MAQVEGEEVLDLVGVRGGVVGLFQVFVAGGEFGRFGAGETGEVGCVWVHYCLDVCGAVCGG